MGLAAEHIMVIYLFVFAGASRFKRRSSRFWGCFNRVSYNLGALGNLNVFSCVSLLSNSHFDSPLVQYEANFVCKVDCLELPFSSRL